MKIGTFAINGRISYGIVGDESVLDAGLHLGQRFPDLRSVISAGALDQLEDAALDKGVNVDLRDVQLLKPITNPGKIFGIGVNYPDRSAEYKDNSEQPKYPSIFMRLPASLVAQEQAIVRPPESKQLDYEGEVAAIIGRSGRRITEDTALTYVAGYTICNDGTVRDWLRHGKFNVTPGKNFERSGALGPRIVTTDEIGSAPLRITTRVNGEIRQDDTTDRLIFSIPFLISYISHFCTLDPGDIIITGTPTGAGARFDPPRYLVPGDIVEVEVPPIGILRNRVVDELS
jgi:2-keto-4-pentenoate hydratase/2-oxohepta-3-ene-1,7-dioic acid hydratase in catechol pathway